MTDQKQTIAPHVVRRHRRADRTRAQALSPRRVITSLLAAPVLMVTVAVSLYLRTSPLDPELALRHLIARLGCEEARSVGLARSERGAPGYHSRNDLDQNGIACDQDVLFERLAGQSNLNIQTEAPRAISGAKFLRP